MKKEEFLIRYRDAHYALLRCWDKAKENRRYVKEDWLELQRTLDTFASLAAGAIGYEGPLLSQSATSERDK